MKKFLVIPIMLLYMLAVSGVMVHAHYCGEILQDFKLFVKSDGCAGGECGDETEESDGCCKDEVTTIKINPDQKIESFKLQICVSDVEAVPINFFANRIALLNNHHALLFNQPNAPPGLWQHIPLFKLHSSFTYYG